MNNNVKKFIIPLLTMTCMSMLSGCSRTKIVGGDAAKLLLVEERLDTKGLENSKLSFDFSKPTSKKGAKREIRKNNKVNDLNFNKQPKLSKTGTESKKEGNVITWKNFEEYSNAISYFDSFISNIDSRTKNAISLIDDTKRKADSNNVWINGIGYEHLLQVNANEDIVMRRSNKYYEIVHRTINEQGTEVFDIFNSDIGSKNGGRVRKVGDYRYEYSYINNEIDFNHFFIADKSRGYWIIQSPVNEREFSTTIIKDDRVYDYTVDFETNQVVSVKIITKDANCDILRINGDIFSFYPGALTNIDSLSMVVNENEIGNSIDYTNPRYKVFYDEDEKEYITIGTYSPDINLSNGKIIKNGDKFAGGKVEYTRSILSGNADGILGDIEFIVQGDNIQSKINNLETFFKETGISFIRDYQEIINSIKISYEDATSATNSISWNGFNIENKEIYAQATNKEQEKLDYFLSKYNEVKDNTILSRNQQGSLDRNTSFPYVISSSFNASYKDNLISINSSSLKVDDLTLFEQGKKYSIEYALAAYSSEEEGYYELLPIATDNQNTTTYNNETQFDVSSSNISFILPVPQAGDYELVSYIVNQEGIRVTRPQPIKVNSVTPNQISIHNYTADVSKNDEGLLNVTSKVNENITLKIDEPKQSYTYSELYRLLSVEAYMYGVVIDQKMEKLNESSSWVKLNGNENNLTSGTYRIAFTNQNNEVVYASTTF